MRVKALLRAELHSTMYGIAYGHRASVLLAAQGRVLHRYDDCWLLVRYVVAAKPSSVSDSVGIRVTHFPIV